LWRSAVIDYPERNILTFCGVKQIAIGKLEGSNAYSKNILNRRLKAKIEVGTGSESSIGSKATIDVDNMSGDVVSA
jgi:hypothetical protein